MKILYISEYWHPRGQGGGEISTSLLAQAAALKDTDVHVLTSFFDGLQRIEMVDNLTIHREITTGTAPNSLWGNMIRWIRFPSSARAAIKHTLQQSSFDILHYLNVTSMLGKVVSSAKSLVHVNSPVPFCPKGTLMYQDQKECHYKCTPTRFWWCFVWSHEFGRMKNRFWYRFNPVLWIALYLSFRKRVSLLKTFDHCTANSKFMEQKLIEIGISRSKITVIPNIVETTTHPLPRTDVPSLLYLGAYIKSKGILQFLTALRDVRAPFQCHFYGEGALRASMAAFVQKYGLADRVFIHGPVPHTQVAQLLDMHDILVQPSTVAEAMPRTVLEALGAGRVVIASNVGGAKDIIKDGENGLLIDPYDAVAFTQTVERVLQDRILRTRLASKAPIAVGAFSKERVGTTIRALYTRLLSTS